jgi:hypothetical protein
MLRNNAIQLTAWQQNALLFLIAGIALCMPTIVRYYWPAGGMIDVTGHPIGRDFINVWIGPQVVANDGVMALFDIKGYAQSLGTYFGSPLPFHNWVYPLFVLPFYWPFAQLPYGLALALWTVLFGALFLWAAVAPVDRARTALAALLIAFSPAAIVNTIGGQYGFITAALLLASMLLLDRRPIVSGVLIGLLIVKPHMGFCLPFILIALGAWRAFIAASVTVVFLLLYTLPFVGLAPWIEYVDTVGHFQSHAMDRFQGFFTNMMVSITAGLRSVGIPYGPALAIQAVVSLAVTAITVLTVRQTTNPVMRAAVVALAVPLITPYAFNYDMTAAAAALAWLVVGPLALPPQYRTVLLMAWLVPALVMIPAIRTAFVPQILMLAAFAIVVRMAWGWQPEDSTESAASPAAA